MSARKPPKKILTANLLALAAADAAADDGHRARFDRLMKRIREALADAQGPEVIRERGLDSDFAEARLIARDRLRMKEAEFEATVADFNGPYSRVVNTCPTGKDTRNLPDFLKMTADDLRLPYDLRTPFEAAFFVVRHGNTWGYSEAQIARAEIEFRKLDRARRARIAEADEVRAAAESTRIASRATAAYTATLYAPDGTSRTYP